MSIHTPDATAITNGPLVPPAAERGPRTTLGPRDLADWLGARIPGLGEAWAEEIRLRGLSRSDAIDGVLGRFTARLASFLPPLMGPRSDMLEALWARSAELYGALAAKRGLAAGEVIEEFQLLRHLLIRELYRDPPAGGRMPLSLREILRLNRIVDGGVTHASVGHTDAMFFHFFESREDSDFPLAAVVREAEAQLEAIRDEMEQLVGATMSTAPRSPTEH